MARYIALVPAAGSGSRFGAASPKQYLQLNGKPLMWHTLATLAAVSAIDEVAVVISPQDEWFDDFAWDLPKLRVCRVGGASRAESVGNGLAALGCDADDWVLVHDAARCCLSVAAVERLIATLSGHQVGGLLALPVPDTVKRADSEGHVGATVPRNGLWLAQTPQMFRAGVLEKALREQPADDITDEASAVERAGLKPLLVEGDAQNFKVTYPRDLALARAILAARAGQ
ncbi:2-C-methyl-D-erythritol 4-phosphate cytidylyltransferase [Chromobacterium subtsugae]|uniref:2-C-methyl-D-erythritol 4-phosphate cytidylyltransferase n=1 Tax=Chromobacterium subtsugae TaxID=251747 RepID=A0ABS7F9A3_9NEIS|nr:MULTISPECIES: 2-C-methyl-D-erythritol 4-phosphate cytidylyltransferase [Chromobacterium]KUM02598.1 2-C-methyl-D-erythritol 4-phosphate cytidylyltransferase [Chromobacterium subtsugae]KZE87984.1 2-C-methyl-D-erythritol 4-phosphate cytidylyltransferase [Chromobacterium sp. F49]MBW7565482.1 2-C-methyl-D-erythritol 4-phosphate cytidylyltransferase [Chromobacterium subtsugae]MBW8286668.1 2-C-methyl-D-erythritol 4-phosphate cytidylyltransferase [Chromobacterium subtsugae]WSE90851.1 2-C-methyl-D-e